MKEDRDERTIKEIIEYLKKQNGNCSNELSNVEGLCLVNYIEWLEKEKDRLGKLFYERNEENIRLNNIINELKKENEQLQQQCKKQREVIDKAMNLIKKYGKYDGEKCTQGFQMWSADFNKILDILKEVSE